MFFIGLVVGGVLGVFAVCCCVSAKQADEHAEKQNKEKYER